MQWKLDGAWLLYLWVVGIADIKNLSISRAYVMFGGLLAVISILVKKIEISNLILGCVLAFVFILVSRYTKEAIGYGDSIMITWVSFWLGGYAIIYTLGCAFGMTAIYGGLQKYKRGSGDEEIPFLPFLAAACTLGILSCL